MKKFIVNGVVPVYATVEIEAEDEDTALDEAYELMCLTSYCGNGGNDKLVGVRESNVSLEPGEEVLDGQMRFEITVEEIK